MISVAIIGAGNVATHFYKAFKKSDAITVTSWYSRTITTINSYKNEVSATDKLSELKDADIYIIAVNDDAIKKVSSALPFKNKLVVHTSGSVAIDELNKKNRRGVIYPLQTLSKDYNIDFKNVPLCLEAHEITDYQILKALAKAIGCTYYKINSEQRQTLHLTAVFINNFTNQLYHIAHKISDVKHIDFDILKPLIIETANKVQHTSPYLAQTGPAIRHDTKTIKKHLRLLEDQYYTDIYQLLTKSIQKTHGRKKL